jgi:hypothetical protein
MIRTMQKFHMSGIYSLANFMDRVPNQDIREISTRQGRNNMEMHSVAKYCDATKY